MTVSLSSSVPTHPTWGSCVQPLAAISPLPLHALPRPQLERVWRIGRDGPQHPAEQGWGHLAAHLGQAHSLRVAVGVVSRGVPGLWAASAALSVSSCRSESHSWPGWRSARWPGCQSSRILQRPGWTRDGGQRGRLPLGVPAWGPRGGACARRGQTAPGGGRACQRTHSSPGLVLTPLGLHASGDRAPTP